jgi:hypothetical protein
LKLKTGLLNPWGLEDPFIPFHGGGKGVKKTKQP